MQIFPTQIWTILHLKNYLKENQWSDWSQIFCAWSLHPFVSIHKLSGSYLISFIQKQLRTTNLFFGTLFWILSYIRRTYLWSHNTKSHTTQQNITQHNLLVVGDHLLGDYLLWVMLCCVRFCCGWPSVVCGCVVWRCVVWLWIGAPTQHSISMFFVCFSLYCWYMLKNTIKTLLFSPLFQGTKYISLNPHPPPVPQLP